MAEVTETNIQTDVPAENQSVERCLTFESGDMTLFLSINNVTEIINDCAITHLPLVPDYIKGITLLGGEPMEQVNQQGLLPLLRQIREKLPDKSVWCFTGYDYEKDVLARMVPEWEETKEFLSYLDVLVDGEFKIEQKDLGLIFKGSANQRTILVQESLREGHIVYWDPQNP